MTDFVVAVVQDAAQRAIEQAEVIRLSLVDQECFALAGEQRIAGYYTLASASPLLADALDRAVRSEIAARAFLSTPAPRSWTAWKRLRY